MKWRTLFGNKECNEINPISFLHPSVLSLYEPPNKKDHPMYRAEGLLSTVRIGANFWGLKLDRSREATQAIHSGEALPNWV